MVRARIQRGGWASRGEASHLLFLVGEKEESGEDAQVNMQVLWLKVDGFCFLL